MKTNIATLIGAVVQSNMLLDRPYEFTPNTTLNERLEVQAGVAPNATERMAIRYAAIGRGGHRWQVGGDGEGYTSEVGHKITDMSLFKPLPFIMRPIEAGLSPQQRAMYAGRVVEEHGGRLYEVWYLRDLNTLRSKPVMEINGDTGPRPFVPDRSNLFPVADQLATNAETQVSGEYASCTTTFEFNLSATDVEEIIECCRIIYNNPNLAVISEIGLVASARRVVKGRGPGNQQIDYTEALCATLLSILVTYHSLPAASRGIEELLEMGTTEPMLLNTGVMQG